MRLHVLFQVRPLQKRLRANFTIKQLLAKMRALVPFPVALFSEHLPTDATLKGQDHRMDPLMKAGMGSLGKCLPAYVTVQRVTARFGTGHWCCFRDMFKSSLPCMDPTLVNLQVGSL